jgi:hypothetical protein
MGRTTGQAPSDRPIFFVELREHYVCCWCEMHGVFAAVVQAQTDEFRAALPGWTALVALVSSILLMKGSSWAPGLQLASTTQGIRTARF